VSEAKWDIERILIMKCQEGTVFVKGGQNAAGATISDLCVDKHEFTNADALKVIVDQYTTSLEGFDGPNQPMVNVSGNLAKQYCEAKGKRLLTPDEYEYVASQKGTKPYSTKSGELDKGVQWYQSYFFDMVDSTRDVCAASGYYIEYDGEEICDMSGNVSEWTNDETGLFYLMGGSWKSVMGPWLMSLPVSSYDESKKTIFVTFGLYGLWMNVNIAEYNPELTISDDIGFRCASTVEP
jgi:formylglycine-generating enzyme required for sulfatase activity